MSLRLNIPKFNRSISACTHNGLLRRMIYYFSDRIKTSNKLGLLSKLIIIEFKPYNNSSMTSAINSVI